MNTFGMKVKARCFVEYDSVADLVDIEFEELARPVLHIGGGSNLLFTDDFKGTVLHSKIDFIEILDECCEDVQEGGFEKLNPSHSGEWAPPTHEAVGGHGFSNHSPEHIDCHSGRTTDSHFDRSIDCHSDRTTDCHSDRSTDCHSDRSIDCHSSACAPATSSMIDRAERVEKSSSPVLVSVGAGVVFDDFCEWAAKEGLWGVENLSYIPGEVGASAVQNIGAYGVEVKDVIRTVYCYDTVEEEFVNFDVEECEYGYRDSIFKDPEIRGRYIVTHVVFALSREPKPRLDYGHLKTAVLAASPSFSSDADAEENILANITPALIRKVIIKIRKEKLPEPSVMGSAGSFFKNPVITVEHFARIEAAAKAEFGADYKVPYYVIPSGSPVIPSEAEGRVEESLIKIPAAWLIEQCGWKGRRSGNAAVWDKQPLVIVNYTGEAFPEEIIGLERRIIASVKAKFDIELHPEVDHI